MQLINKNNFAIPFTNIDNCFCILCPRPHNDKDYPIDSSKLRSLGWYPKMSWDKGLDITSKFMSKIATDLRINGSGLKPLNTFGKIYVNALITHSYCYITHSYCYITHSYCYITHSYCYITHSYCTHSYCNITHSYCNITHSYCYITQTFKR